MKINNNGISQTASTPIQPSPAPAPTPRDTAAETVAQDSATYTPSADWLRLLDLAKQEPEIRADRVRAAAERLQNGDYLSPESAAAAADAMLNSLD